MMPKGDVLGALIETTPFDIELPSVALISEQRKRGKKKQPPLCYWIYCFLLWNVIIWHYESWFNFKNSSALLSLYNTYFSYCVTLSPELLLIFVGLYWNRNEDTCIKNGGKKNFDPVINCYYKKTSKAFFRIMN